MSKPIPRAILEAINEAFSMLPSKMDTAQARVLVYAIGLQESGFEFRRQVVMSGGRLQPVGPAKGFWQFERRGGCHGVVSHFASRYWMADVCRERGCLFTSAALWDAIEHDDVLAAAAARLLLFTDQSRLPDVGDQAGAWRTYERVWRPGQPHPSAWARNYAQAIQQLQLETA